MMRSSAHEQSEEEFLSELYHEGKMVPEEHRKRLLQIIHLFRESVSWPSAEEEFSTGWKEIKEGKTHPIETLWDGIDAD